MNSFAAVESVEREFVMHVHRWKRRRRASLALLTGLVALLVIAAPALGQTDSRNGGQDQPYVVLTGRADVRTGETYESVVVLNGSASIDGTVTSSVVVLNGDAVVRGHVGEDVVAVNGRVTLEGGASVGRDVVSSKPAGIAPAAHVSGQVRNTPTWQLNVGQLILLAFLVWLAVTISLFVLGLVVIAFAPRAVDATIRSGQKELGWSALWGVILAVGIPVVAVVALATVVGIPLGLALLFGLFPVSVVGFLVSSWILGDVILRKPGRRVLAFIIGFVILEGLSLIPYVSSVIWVLASIFGIGAVAVAVWRARNAPAPVPATGQPVITPSATAPVGSAPPTPESPS